MIRVLIKASSPIARAGLESLIRGHSGIEAVDGSTDDDSESGAIEQADVVLAELESRDEDSVSEVIAEARAGIPIILLVRGPAAEWLDVWREGVKAVLASNVTGAQIAAAIEAVAAGLAVFESSDMEQLLAVPKSNGLPKPLPEPLTPREVEVLRLMAEGLGNKEIAERLAISEHTVKFHVASVMGKLAANSRTEAVTSGIRHGLVIL
jgi:DNA-binding NarL/FixJ family response regulator